MSPTGRVVDEDRNSTPTDNSRTEAPTEKSTPESMDEFFTRLQSDMRRPDLSQEAITEAFHAIQRLALDYDAEASVNPAAAQGGNLEAGSCPSCGAHHDPESRFCASCGVPVTSPLASEAAGARLSPGQHHYHHHYHHHYFQASQASALGATQPVSGAAPVRDTPRLRVTPGAPSLSRAEATVRQITGNWALACNTKHLDDLVGLYSADALVLRSNVPAVRGTAAIREFFFAVLDAGLGDVEFEPLRVELFGEVAYEAGRCKMLAPTAMGKRREERGKYQMVFHRQEGEWRIIADCWSSDLSLGAGLESPTKLPAPPAGILPRPRK